MIPNHFNHTTNINNLWTRSYQKIKPLNTTKIISLRFGFVPLPTFLVSVCLLPWQFPILGLRGARYVTQPVIMVTNKFFYFIFFKCSMADFTKGTLPPKSWETLKWKPLATCLGLFYAALFVLTGRLVSDGHSDSDQQGFVLTLFSDVG